MSSAWVESISPEQIFAAVFAFTWVEYAFEAYLSSRQRKARNKSS